ncbi:MAG: EAL domain-containing protein [Mobilitalea sp.]
MKIFYLMLSKVHQFLEIKQEFVPRRGAFRVAGIYALSGILWILLSDKLLELLVKDVQTMARINLIKGWIYVLFTAVLIFGLVYVALKRINQDRIKLDNNYQEVTATYEELEATYEELTASEEEIRQQYDLLMESQTMLAVSEQRTQEYQEQLHFLAYHDTLTKLPNRLSFDQDNRELGIKEPDSLIAVCYVDIDNFKLINDTWGHNFGDQLIGSLSTRISSYITYCDLIYRLGGDEFIIVLKGARNLEEIKVQAKKILDSLEEPFYIFGNVIHISISMGIALYPEHGKDSDELLRCADIAMYKAKKAGGNSFFIYSSGMQEDLQKRMIIEKYLYAALEEDEFELYYQPQLDISSNKITGIEALLRWKNKELGFVSPLQFIGIAEETQLIIPIGKWVLRQSCAYIKKLQEQGHSDITVSVNVSILQLVQNDFIECVFQTLEEYELNPECLELEITESILMESYDMIKNKLSALYEKGIKIALDDFGTGYSSLNYLLQLPINTLKIDKTFVDGITLELKNKQLTGQIVMIGRSMGLNVVAEGVETKEQFNYLKQNNCDKIQGFLYSKPLPEKELEVLLSRENLILGS